MIILPGHRNARVGKGAFCIAGTRDHVLLPMSWLGKKRVMIGSWNLRFACSARESAAFLPVRVLEDGCL